MIRSIFLYVLFSISLFSFSQKEIYIHFSPTVNNSSFSLNTDYSGIDGKAFNLIHFKYYISDISLTHDGGNVTSFLDSSHIYLIDHDNYTIHLGNHNITSIESIDFTMGVPSRYNTISGANSQDISTYPSSHALSFQSPSMYWGWSTGYMHMIVGGTVDTDNNGTPETTFELHNLGNQNQQTISQMNVIQTNSNANEIGIYMLCNIEQWLKNINLGGVGMLHGETGENQAVLQNVSNEPVFTQPNNASIYSSSENGKLFYQGNGREVLIKWKNLHSARQYRLYSIDGKLIKEQIKISPSGILNIHFKTPGKYLFKVYDDNGNKIKSLNLLIP